MATVFIVLGIVAIVLVTAIITFIAVNLCFLSCLVH